MIGVSRSGNPQAATPYAWNDSTQQPIAPGAPERPMGEGAVLPPERSESAAAGPALFQTGGAVERATTDLPGRPRLWGGRMERLKHRATVFPPLFSCSIGAVASRATGALGQANGTFETLCNSFPDPVHLFHWRCHRRGDRGFGRANGTFETPCDSFPDPVQLFHWPSHRRDDRGGDRIGWRVGGGEHGGDSA
jgi:hypothetical protein